MTREPRTIRTGPQFGYERETATREVLDQMIRDYGVSGILIRLAGFFGEEQDAHDMLVSMARWIKA